ncbi:hypothetical protein [Pseudorhodoferax sp.]|uniref:hypothetical protein n=1 Tax=Pseudorhodoferax sp. TaxID=1993553 RepID=UPI0039E6A330
MLHPIFSTVVARPDLVVDHLSAYVTLAGEEAAATGREFKRRMLAWAVAGVAALLFVAFAGIAAMLAAVNGQFHWALAAVPGAALLVALLALLAGRAGSGAPRFAELRRQVAADVGLLRASRDARHGH